ncbi:MAG: RAMP superfamily CRISPR-associated protein, partial [bacterium]
MRLNFIIKLLSDTHISSGYGKGNADQTYVKDEKGEPVIKGTTLSGLLRQGISDLLQLKPLNYIDFCGTKDSKMTYCRAGNIEELCPQCRILGTPVRKKSWAISSAKIKDPLNSGWGKVIWRNKVNLLTGTAEDHKLFSQEVISSGTEFSFSLTNNLQGQEILDEASFIVAAFRMIKSIGSSRRRGKGECDIYLNSCDVFSDKQNPGDVQNRLLEHFSFKWLKEKGARKIETNRTNKQFNSEKNSTNKTKSFQVVIKNEEPLIISNKGEAGNEYFSIDYIPAQTFLGTLAWKIAVKYDLEQDEKAYNKFIDFFKKGGVKISNLFPAVLSKNQNHIFPTIKAPLDYLIDKYHPFEKNHEFINGAIKENEPGLCPGCDNPLTISDKYLQLRNVPEGLSTYEVNFRNDPHIEVDTKTGQSVENRFFNYRAIESGQFFAGILEVKDWETFSEMLGLNTNETELNLRIGKASTRGYGKVIIRLIPDSNVDKFFIGKKLEKRINLKEPITMTLMSDAVLVDPWGRFKNSLDEEYLSNLFSFRVKIINSYNSSKNIDGFNSYLGLPKWRDKAISAGSSIGFKIIDDTLDSEEVLNELKNIEQNGIGLRRAQGFGHVAFNHPIYDKNQNIVGGIDLPEELKKKLIEKPSFTNIDKKIERLKNAFNKMFEKMFIEKDGYKVLSDLLYKNSDQGVDLLIEKIRDFHNCWDEINKKVREKNPSDKKVKLLNEEIITEDDNTKDKIEKSEVIIEK